MKILYDHQIFSQQKFGGISRYFCELMQFIQKKELADVELATKYSNNAYLENSSFSSKLSLPPDNSIYSEFNQFLPRFKFRGKGRLFNLLRKIKNKKPINFGIMDFNKENVEESIRALENRKFDIFHPTYYDPYFLDYLNGKPYVITVYDMIHEIFPEYSPLDELTKLVANKGEIIKKAFKVIVISKQTKKDLIDILGIEPSKIEVIYLASSLNKKEKFALPDKFILFVGSRHIYKNFYLACRAIAILRKKASDLKFVCCGGGRFTDIEKEFFRELNIIDNIYYCEPNDAQLSYIYSKAELFIFPALYEGFGIPLLEAFNSGCPVVASNIGCFREVAEEAAVFFEPKNVGSIIFSIERVLSNKNFRKSIIEKGSKRAKEFSWEKTVKRTMEVYQSIL